MKVCTKCGIEKDESEFRSDVRNLDGFLSWCKSCEVEGVIKYQHTERGKLVKRKADLKYSHSTNGRLVRNEIHRRYSKRKYDSVRREIFGLLGDKCVRCGSDNLKILQIHHVDGNGYKSRYKVSLRGYYSHILEDLRNGSKDYSLLCPNCNWIERYERNENKKRDGVYYMVRDAIFCLLGGRCVDCGNSDYRILQIDHVEGKGKKEIDKFSSNYKAYYRDILNQLMNGNCNKYQLLCPSCNWEKKVENKEVGNHGKYKLDTY